MVFRVSLANWREMEIVRLLGGTAFIFSCRIFASGVTFVTYLLLARWMGASELGKYVLANSWLIMLAVFPASGYADAAIRFVGQGLARGDHGYVRGFVRHSTKIVILSSLTITVVGSALILAIPQFPNEMRMLFFIALAGVPFFALIRLNAGIANAFSKFALSFLPNNIFRPVLFLAGVSLVWAIYNDLEATSVLAINLTAIVVVAISMTILTHLPIMQSLESGHSNLENELWVRTALSLLALILFSNYFQQITVIGIGFFLPSAEIGVYSVTYQIAMLILISSIAVDAFAAPALSRHFSRKERGELVRVIQHATQLRVILSVVGVVFLIVFGEHILRLFGEEFVAGHTVMVILGLSQVSYAAVGPAIRLLGISGFQMQGVYASVGALLLWMVLAAVLLPFWGLTGVAISVFLTWSAWSATLRHLVMRKLGIDMLIRVRDMETHSLPDDS